MFNYESFMYNTEDDTYACHGGDVLPTNGLKKGIARASSEVGFMFIAYNLRRIMNIMTGERLKEYLEVLLTFILGFSGLTEAVIMNSEFIPELLPVYPKLRSEYRKSHLNRAFLK
jgi:hypothetical protein